MNRRNIFSLSAITAFGVALLPGSAISQQKSLKDQLVGAWTPVSWEQVKKDGSKLNRFGSNMKGFNVFDANGRASRLGSRLIKSTIQGRRPSRWKLRSCGPAYHNASRCV